MLDYFESMVSDYKNSREEFFSLEKTDSDKIEEYIGCSMTAQELRKDSVFLEPFIPETLEITMALLYSGLKHPFYRFAFNSKRGAIWEQTYKIYHSDVKLIERWLYPVIIKLEEIDLGQGISDGEDILQPKQVICSLEDIEVGTYLAHMGEQIVFIDFTVSEEEEDEREGADKEEDQDQEHEVTTLSYMLKSYDNLSQELQRAVDAYLQSLRKDDTPILYTPLSQE